MQTSVWQQRRDCPTLNVCKCWWLAGIRGCDERPCSLIRTDCDINLFASPSAPRLSQFLVSMPTWLPIRGDYPPRPHQTRRRPRLVPQPPMSVDFTPSLYGRLQRARNGLHRHQIFEAEVIRRSRKRHYLLVTRVLLVDPEADCFRNAWLHVPKAIQTLQPASRTGLLLLTVSLFVQSFTVGRVVRFASRTRRDVNCVSAHIKHVRVWPLLHPTNCRLPAPPS